MRRTFFATLFVGYILLSAISFGATYGGGSGTAEDPYQIWTPEQMNTIGANSLDWGKCFRLLADIDMSAYAGTQYNIIGNSTTKFTGIFDGNNHKIGNLTYTTTATVDYVGLFGYLGSGGQIGNLGVENVNITGSDYIGGLVGVNDGDITSCYSTGLVNGSYYVGGLVGRNPMGAITSCYSTGMVLGIATVGGLSGDNEGIITSCYSSGSVKQTSQYLDPVGGLVGENYFGTIVDCYSTASISGTGYVGGLVGDNIGSVKSCFWDTQVSGLNVGIGARSSIGATGKTTLEMKTLSTFISAGWDFTNETVNGTCNYWIMGQNSYPLLAVFNGFTPPQLNGNGTDESPYLITDADNLGTIWYRPSAYYELTKDIDLSGIAWNTAVIPLFDGQLDGKGFGILNLSINGGGYLGLIGIISSGTVVKNIGIMNIAISDSEDVPAFGAGSYISGLAGYNNGSINNCHSTGMVSGNNYVSGLVGSNGGNITRCYCNIAVSGTGYGVGGLLGENSGSITSCCSIGSVRGTDKYNGGLVGRNFTGTITNCYSVATVTGTGDCVGGLTGACDYGSIRNCYSTGPVMGSSYVGGLMGYNSNIVTACFWDIQTSGWNTSGGGAGKTTSAMQTLSTFTSAGWSISTNNGTSAEWRMPSAQDYPKLSWQLPVSIPNLVGLTQTAAQTAIITAGFTVGSITSSPSTNVPLGSVISQSPASGTSALVGTKINLVISLGTGMNVPDVTELSQADAQSILLSAGFTIGAITTDYHSSVPVGIVISQSPVAGQSVFPGIPVNLVISLGKHYSGSGTAADPFLISTPQNLIEIGATPSHWGKCFKLISDIDMSAYTDIQYNIIGTLITPFSGTFDGKGYKIFNLKYTITSRNDYVGMFGYASNATIKNIGIENVDVSVTNTTSDNYTTAGGLVGWLSNSTVSNCYSIGKVIISGYQGGEAAAGGLVGWMDSGTITNCSSAASVASSTPYCHSDAGGLVGNHNSGTIINCFSTGSVTASKASPYSEFSCRAGGLAAVSGGIITNCYSTGRVTATGTNVYKGGLIGYGGSTTYSFWDTQTSGLTTSAGGTGKTTAQMKTQSTFTGWDFTNTWYMAGYPSLRWEINPLQARIDAASNGATIIVQPGLYQGRIYFKGKNITLTSTNPQDSNIVASTVIEGLGGGSVITFAGTETLACILTGFTITGGNSATSGGGVIGNDCSASIQNCRFYGNTAAGAGGGIWGVHGPIENCVIYDNTASWGGGIAKSNGIIRNCLVFGNQSPNATGLNNCGGTIQNCTIVSDKTLPLLRICNGTIQNCILQTPGSVFDTCTAVVSYTCLPGATGRGNISFDPMFVDPNNDNYHLLPESPCMDAGNPASDYSLEPLPNGGRIDLGAYGNTPQATLSRNVLTSLGFQIISKTRTGRTLFEYELAVVVRNPNAYDMSNVQMKLKDWDAAVVSVSDDSITINTIPAGATVTSTDTFKIVVDRSMLIVPGMLTWDLIYYVPGGQVQQAMMSMPLSAIDIVPGDTVPGDITGDGKINLDDFVVMSMQWNTDPGIHSADIALPLDGYVGIEDLMYLAENWLK